MAEFQTIAQRSISGQGVLRVPSDFKKRRLVILYCDVFRQPKNLYLNRNWLPDRGKYGYVTFFRNNYLIGEASIDFPRQSWDTVTDLTSQNLIAIKCMYDGVLKSFQNLVNGIAATPGGIGLFYAGTTDLIKDYEYLDLAWDEVRVKCYADTALYLQLVMLPHDTCDEEKDKPRKPPPPPPPPPSVPPGTPVVVDPPYRDDDNPDDITEHYPGDDDEVTGGDGCSQYDVEITATSRNAPPYVFTVRLYGEIEGAGLTNNGLTIYVLCRGGRDSIDPPAGECLPEVTQCLVGGDTGGEGYTSARVTRIVPV